MNSALKLIVLISSLVALPIRAEPLTNSGPTAYGVQITMSLSNSVFSRDKVIRLQCVIKNASTNIAYLFNPPGDFEETTVTLTSSLGDEHTLSPGFGVGSTKSAIEVAPEGQHTWAMPLTLGNDLPTGDYKLRVKRWIMFRSAGRTSGTNVTCDLSVRVESGADSTKTGR